ncbi:MAG: DUF4435 domain-containing protein [Thermoanaerobaculia bacterium]|nr:DUF4435 domain-containing protein [Thermoanaerobaculia bacterium]
MSLASLKTPADVEVEVLMSRAAFDGAFLIVEGDDDSRFFHSRIEDSTCEIVNAGGKLTVIGGMERLNSRRFRGALGVVDDDCDTIDGRWMAHPNLVSTGDVRDLDALLIWSPAFDKVLAEYASPSRIKKLGGAAAVRDRLVEIALPFGSLRRWAASTQTALDFKELRPFRFVEPSWIFDPPTLFTTAAKALGLATGTLIAQIAGLSQADPRSVCQGHDLIAILARGLVKGGILGSSSPGSATLGSALRLALDQHTWLATILAQDIVGWETTNPPFRVLQQR